MRLLALAVSGVALCASVAFGSLPAAADTTGTLSSCVKHAEQVNQALASNQQSSNYEAALKEKGYGRDFCTNGFYDRGVEHYEQALKLLGADRN